MKTRFNNKLAILALSLVGGVALGSGALTAEKVGAENNAFETAQITMMKGASVRCNTENTAYGESGIRFSALIDSEQYAALEKMEETANTKVSYGMLIAPYEYFTQYGEFNGATVFGVDGERKYTWEGDETVQEGQTLTKIAHVTYQDLIASTADGYDGYHEIKGSLINIKEENLTREFVAKGYIKYEYTVEGETGLETRTEYKFASYQDGNVANNVRSIVYVAQLAIEDEDGPVEWLQENYVDKAATVDTTYTVETYVGETLVKTEVNTAKVGATVEGVEAIALDGFNLISAETSGTVYANGKLVLKHVYAENEAYQVKNGGFENGAEGWTVTGEIGAISTETHYWKNDELSVDGFPFGLDGTAMFSSYAITGSDEKVGALMSEAFKIGGSGWLTFKIGGMKVTPLIHVEIVDAETNEVYKRYGNTNFTDAVVDNVKLGCKLHAYKANVSDLLGKMVYIRVSDYAMNEYGVVFADSFNALHFVAPDDSFALATELGFSTNEYELYNGTFANGMDGWYKVGNIGGISEVPTYWAEQYPFNNEGKYFSCYDVADQFEGARGWLRSGVFKIGGSGYITYRIGGVKNPDQVYIEVIDALTGEKIGHFYNEYMRDCTLISYKADLSDFIGRTVYLNIVDNAEGDYGLIFCDEFITYYETVEAVPAYNVAINCMFNVMNGGFETGNLSGWSQSGETIGRVTDFNYFWNNEENVIGKEGNFSFTGVEIKEGLWAIEGTRGSLRSNTFTLKAYSSISFKLGGCRSAENDFAVALRIVNATTGEIIAQYNNPNRQDAKLIDYSYDINNAEAVACYVELWDDASNDWGLIGVDSIRVFQK